MKKIRPQEKYDKDNMQLITAKYKKDFVQQFKSSCTKLGITQSQVIRNAMEEIIKEANK